MAEDSGLRALGFKLNMVDLYEDIREIHDTDKNGALCG